MSLVESSFREHPELVELFRTAEARQLTDEELEQYLRVLPGERLRADTARAIRAIELSVVKQTVRSIFTVYPYEEHHEFATAKCARDVRYVSAYATMSMLMNDVQWFDDKLLYWLKTILQAFEFPDKVQRKKLLFGRASTSGVDGLDAKRKSIWETYTRLLEGYQAQLTPEQFRTFEPYLRRAVDVLASE